MKRSFNTSLALIALAGMFCYASVAEAQKDVERRIIPRERVRQLMERFAQSPLADTDEGKELKDLLDRVQQGKPLTPDQFAKLFEKMQTASPSQPPSKHAKNNKDVQRVFRSVVATASKSTVSVLRDGKQVALGTVVDDKGHVLTKASELMADKKFSNKVACKVASSKPREAKIVGVSEEHDLALLKIESKNTHPIKWEKTEQPAIGSWLASAGLTEDPVAVGVVSVAPRKVGVAGGFLGVMLDQADDGPIIEQVVPKSAAAEAGLKVKDVVTMVNEKRVKTREELVATVREFKPGEVIKLTVKRDGNEMKLNATLGRRDISGARAGRLRAMNRMGGPISKRRSDFPNVLQHDTILRPEQCGGPIVDLDGRFVGVNIARAGRVASYAVPTETIQAILPNLTSGKLAPKPEQIASADVKDPAAKSKAELKAMLDRVKQAEEELRRSQEKLKKAREELEKAEKQ